MIRNRFPLGRSPLALAAGLLLATLAGCTTLPNDVLRQYASEALRDNDIPKANEYLAQAVKQDPTDWVSQYMLGRVELAKGNPVRAESCFEQALVNRVGTKDEAMILDGVAEALLKQENKGRLAGFLKQQAHDHPTVGLYLWQAKFLAKMGDPDGAVLSFKKAAGIAGKHDATPYLAAADYYESINDREDQVLALRRAYTADQDSTPVYVHLRLAGLEPSKQLFLPPEE
jgi:tetratricopeptide (TPR) repeat protein